MSGGDTPAAWSCERALSAVLDQFDHAKVHLGVAEYQEYQQRQERGDRGESVRVLFSLLFLKSRACALSHWKLNIRFECLH
jgi:hypothetical protein